MKRAIHTGLAAACLAFAQEPNTIIRVPVRVVEIPTAVLAKSGQPVHGVRPEEFSLVDNGRPQRFQVEAIDEPLSIAIVVQTSNSAATWLPQIRRARSTLEALLIGETGEAAISTFSDGVKLLQPLTASTSLLDKALSSMTLTGSGARCLDAVAAAADMLKQTSPERRRVILLIAQSGDVGSRASLRDVLETLELGNITVYSLVMPRLGRALVEKTVSIGSVNGGSVNGVTAARDTGIMGSMDLGKLVPEIYRSVRAASKEDALTIVTSEMGGRQIPFRRLRDLDAGISAIGEELHTEYLLSFTPDSPDPGYHRVRVDVSRPDAEVRSRPGYFVSQ